MARRTKRTITKTKPERSFEDMIKVIPDQLFNAMVSAANLPRDEAAALTAAWRALKK